MAPIAWVIAAFVLMGIVQFALYRYLRDRGDASIELDASTDVPRRTVLAESPDETEGGGNPDVGDAVSGRRCSACGAINDPSYTFCRRCVGRIDASTR